VTSGEVLREFRSPLAGLSHIQAIALSRNGSRLAAVAFPVRQDGADFVPDGDATTIAVWTAASDEPIITLKHKKTQDVILSPDGRLLAAWDTEGEITIWMLPHGKELHRFRVGRAPVFCLAFGRDPVWHGDDSLPPWLLAVGESHGLVTVWDLRSHRPRSICRGSRADVRAMDFSADGAFLLTGGAAQNKLWDVATGTCLLDLKIQTYIRAITFAPDGRRIALSWDRPWEPQRGAVEVVELELGHGIRTLYGVQGRIEKTAVSADGRLIAAVSHEWQIGVWEWPSGRLRGVLPSPVGRFVDNLGMAFDAERGRFACSGGKQAQMWDLRSERPIKRWDLYEGLCDSLAFMPSGHLLLIRCETQSGREGPFTSVSDPRVVRMYDLLGAASRRLLQEITDFPQHVHAIALAPGGSVFLVDGVTMDKDRPIRRSRVYDAPSGKLLHELPMRFRPGGGWPPRFDPSGKVVALILDEGESGAGFSMYDLPGMRPRGIPDLNISCLGPGATLAMGDPNEQPAVLALLDVARGRPLLLRIAMDVEAYPNSFQFSPDGLHVMFGRSDGTLSILNLNEVNRRLSGLHLGW
jgi:WD40 repeat protein